MKNSSLKTALLIFSSFLISCNSKEEAKKAERNPTYWEFTLRVFGAQRNPLQQIVFDTDWDSAYYLNSTINTDPTHPYPYKLQYKIPFFLSDTEIDSVYNMSKRIHIKCRSQNNKIEKVEKYITGYVEFNLHAPINEKHFECIYYGTEKALKVNHNMEVLLKFFNDKLYGKAKLE